MTREEFRAKERARGKLYRERNKEKVASQHRLYKVKNRAKVYAQQAMWAAKNPEKRRAYVAKHRRGLPLLVLRERERKYNLAKYGVTPAAYAELLIAQGGGCAICGSPPPRLGRFKHLSVDHDHETGRVRGLLCQNCNIHVVPAVEYNDNLIEAAKLYLDLQKERAANA